MRWLATPTARALFVLAVTLPHLAVASDAPLQSIGGELRRVDSGLDEPVTDEVIGDFRVDADPGGDVYTAPAQAILGVFESADPAGSIVGSTLRINGVRRVDPATGRPLLGSAPDGATCSTGLEAACLPSLHCQPATIGPLLPCDVAASVDLFDALSDWTIGFNTLDPEAGRFTIWNSPNSALTGVEIDPEDVLGDFDPSLSELLANVLVGNAFAQEFVSDGFAGAFVPLTTLNEDPCDGKLADCSTPGLPGSSFFGPGGPTLNSLLTSQQQALLGCGEFYGTNCEASGVAFLNMEAGAFAQCWPTDREHDLAADVPQPCTVGGTSLPVCDRDTEGGTALLPGCRAPGDPGYDVDVDGSPTGLFHPLVPSSQQFRSELAALSFNALLFFVVASEPSDPPAREANEFDARDPAITASNTADDDGDGEIDEDDEGDPDHIGPYRTDGCSFRKAGRCWAVRALREASLSVQPEGDPRDLPRVRWNWESGADFAIERALEGLACFADWSLHSLGPEVSRIEPGGLAVRFVLAPPGANDSCESSLVQPAPGPDRIPGTPDDRHLGIAYGVPEPSLGLMRGAALGVLALLARARTRRGL